LVFIYFLKEDFRVVRAVVFNYLGWVAVIYLREVERRRKKREKKSEDGG
jgi:predicted membrane channel-forming protein YqfA (hemolysin III family)